MNKPERTSADLRFFTLWCLAGVCEAPLLALILGWPPAGVSVFQGACLHVLAAILIFLAPPPGRGYFLPTRHWGEGLGTLTLLLPAAGWALSGVFVFLNGRAPFDKDAYIFDEPEEEDANVPAGTENAGSMERELADAMDVIPAVDALLSGVPGLRRGAVETLSRIQTPEAISWLQRVRGETDPELRFYATTALTRLKHDFDLAVSAAEKEVYSSPGELAPRVSLQRIRFEYAASGMLDEEASLGMLADCREKLAPLLGRSPEAGRLMFLIERRLNPERALQVLDRLEEEEPENRARWTRERAELLFERGRHGDVRELLKSRKTDFEEGGPALENKRKEWQSILFWWTDD